MFDYINFLRNAIITKPAVKAISAFSTGLDFGGTEVSTGGTNNDFKLSFAFRT